MNRPAASWVLVAALAASPAAFAQSTPEILDSWYRVTRDEAHVGFARERLVRSGPDRHEYLFEGDFDLLPSGGGEDSPVRISLKVSGTLDAAFDPILLTLCRSDDAGRIEVSAGPGRRVTVVESGVRRRWEIDGRGLRHLFQPLTIYRMRRDGLLGASAVIEARGLSWAAPGAASPQSIAVLPSERSTVLGRKDVPLQRLKFSEGDRNEECWVDGYGRVVRRDGLLGWPVRLELVKGADEAGIGRSVAQAGRRDPFGAPLIRREEAPTTMLPDLEGAVVEAAPVGRDGLGAGLRDAAELVGVLRSHVAEGREADAAGTFGRFLALYRPLREAALEFEPHQAGSLDLLRSAAEDLYGGAARVMARARAASAAIDDALEAADPGTIRSHAGLLVRLAERAELYAREKDLAEMAVLLDEAERKERRAAIRSELFAKRIEVTGVVILEASVRETIAVDLSFLGARVVTELPAMLRRSRAVAAINGEAYREGDVVRGEGVRVERIHRDRVEVSLKEELRDLPVRKAR